MKRTAEIEIQSNDLYQMYKQTFMAAERHAFDGNKSAHVACTVVEDGRAKKTCASSPDGHAEMNALCALAPQASMFQCSTQIDLEPKQWVL